MKKVFKNDAFRKARGGYSRMLAISCESCGEYICTYQKDGPGILKRIYLDRISDSKKYSNLDKTSIKSLPLFKCPKCSQVMGLPMIYKKESRMAYRLFVGAVIKKIVKSK